MNARSRGKPKQIKESLIAIEVFERGPSWDPQSDALVRVQMRNLRQHLKLHDLLGSGSFGQVRGR
jgi:hypothetical protein